MMFSARDYARLHDVVFSGGWPGYRPEVKELPNGDGRVDAEKRYAHVAVTYLRDWCGRAGTGHNGVFLPKQAVDMCMSYLMRAHERAVEIARALKCPDAFMPRLEYGALRVLEYPPGAGSHAHTDFDLFTVMLYRDRPGRFMSDWFEMPEAVRALDEHCHMGELGEIVGLGRATQHSVLASPEWQHSLVYFAIPDHAAKLTLSVSTLADTPAVREVSVGDWLTERMARSRKY